jgi:hypothetical protein
MDLRASKLAGHASFVTKGLKLLTLLDVLATFRLRVFSLAAVLTQEAPRTGILHGVRREANFPHKGRW